MSKLTNAELNKLRKEWDKVEGIDVSSVEYKNLKKVFKMRSPEMLKQIEKANIKFLSKLATNELLRRKRDGWEYERAFKLAGLE